MKLALMNPTRLLHPEPDAPARLADEAAPLGPWFHNLHLPDGTRTSPDHPLGDYPANVWDQIKPHLPGDLRGWTALDLGCNAGFHSFELARRGARVTAVDSNPHFLHQARWAARHLPHGDHVAFHLAQIYDLAHWRNSFDLVLFMGIFYHLRYPLLGLDIAAEKTRRLMVFIENPLAVDPTNWWVPDQTATQAVLRSAGLEPERVAEEIYVCRPSAERESIHAERLPELNAATARGSSVP